MSSSVTKFRPVAWIDFSMWKKKMSPVVRMPPCIKDQTFVSSRKIISFPVKVSEKYREDRDLCQYHDKISYSISIIIYCRVFVPFFFLRQRTLIQYYYHQIETWLNALLAIARCYWQLSIQYLINNVTLNQPRSIKREIISKLLSS